MASPGSDTPRTSPAAPIRKPLAILHISKKEEEDRRLKEAAEQAAVEAKAQAAASKVQPKPSFEGRSTSNDMEGLTMADLLGAAEKKREPQAVSSSRRQVDDFDFDEEAFLAALDENEPIGATGDVVTGTVIAHESDGIYVDIGGKAPGFMPKAECGLGVITELKTRFPKGIEVQVLVTREQNADGMVTISCRALALRQAWEKVRQLEKDGKVVQVKLTGFNRGGCTCDLEGLRGFIPRSQLEDGENHEALVGKTIGVAFLEVNPETRKLVLSEKKASTSAKFANLEVGQLVSGQVVSLKPYGFFVDLGGVSGLLHQSSITGGALRDLREAFETGETIQALIMELDPGRGRIGLNTALLENQPGELLVDKAKVMKEAEDRANRARNMIRQKEQSAG
ncbi:MULTISPECIES: S1 RNA-binding domain-containing protein [Synechococcus]|jgi:small subunit ribosomal protein S1|uniref:S1 RNA-binding domain-containing protein n=2 Tax=Synechococcus TaxID=1129 RepID=UPI0009CA052B|nr:MULTISPECIES: S1 RNA-binding domain-containing protein [Synechococcus]MCF8135052.1 S1 RNA-binding domain-containing protein [Synechococcus lacustris]NBV58425.1 S1 RNA-binding domain-containing protein [Synechococcaceae bacterium WB4_2_0811]OON12892.1 MAG: 30S ribosomal protein S1 [Synechococcus lacustris str. Tous]HBU26861.1 30S ribosomal protein S1 [Synechococcales bacterium UBA8138]MCP9794681.1 S1 RNA-binding domain-containing protein [Synechococcus lacustris L1F-Slac]